MKTAIVGVLALATFLALPAPAAAQQTDLYDSFDRADGDAGPDWEPTPFGFPVWYIRNNMACADTPGINLLSQPYCGLRVNMETQLFGDELSNYEGGFVMAPADFSAVLLCEGVRDDGAGTITLRIRNPFTHEDFATSDPMQVTPGSGYYLSFYVESTGYAICTLRDSFHFEQVVATTMTAPWISPSRFGLVLSGASEMPDNKYACGDFFSMNIYEPFTCPPEPTTTTLDTTTTTMAPATTTLPDPTTTTLPEPTTTTMEETTTTIDEPTTTTMETTTTTLPAGPLCAAAPRNDCLSGANGASRLKLRATSHPMLLWKLGAGAEAAEGAFGDPVDGDTEMAFCLYDASASSQPLVSETIAAGEGWDAVSKGLRYSGSGAVRSVALLRNAAGKTQIRVSLAGEGYDDPTLPLTHGVRAQLVVDDGGQRSCWETGFSSAKPNDERRYNAKGPE
ncbi:MAG TPA: hypothetical protein VEL28_03820 [Candidatus Binatia bacterium]|nr:hypothetical protein [Candidatus Binatia bacterium]